MDGQVLMVEGNKEFALWDTVNDSFVSVDGTWSWETADELSADFDRAIQEAGLNTFLSSARHNLKARCVGLAKGNGY